ncbi:MAG: PHB depolymerase family esterase [bacterium]|nr:PHB depolymerase family esterase [bacterium]
MKRAILCCVLLALLTMTPVLGQESTPAAESSGERSLTHDGLERTYLLHVPASYDAATPAPLVLVLHPAGGTGRNMRDLSGFNALANDSGTIVAYPDGIDGVWDYLDIPVNRDPVVDDLGFLNAVLDEISAEFNIDASRIYVTGYSNGGLMTFRVGCELADRLAAVAIIGANMTYRLATDCADGTMIPTLLILGTQDEAFPWLGAMEVDNGNVYGSLSIAQTTGFFATFGDCSGQPQQGEITHETSPVRVLSQSYTGCTNDAEFILLGMVDAGHNWPSDVIVRLPSDSAGTIIDAVWTFFAAHTRE